MLLRSVFALLLLAVGVYSAANGWQTVAPPAPQPVPADTLITLERTICFGTCPGYKLTISADGSVTFEGRYYVKRKGKVESKITIEQLRQLVAEFYQVKYFSLRDRYASDKDGCQEVWTDNPAAITSFRADGKTKTIFHYHGCQEKQKGNSSGEIFPRELTALEAKIDEIVGTKQWIGSEEERQP